MVENGKVVIEKGYSTITVRDVDAASWEDAMAKAKPEANAFLDELCRQYEIPLEIGTGPTVAPQESPAQRHVKRLVIKSRIKGGRRKKVPTRLSELAVRPSDAKAYFRKACLSTDRFDQFRNFYAVVENVSSRIYRKQSGEAESTEVERALRKCFHSRLASLRDTAMADPTFRKNADLVSEVVRILYKANRCQLNHAKTYEDKKVPLTHRTSGK